MKQKTWDETRARALLAEGKSDLEVAEMVGATVGALRSWKSKNGLTQKRSAPAKSETVKAAAETPPKPPPISSLPVEVSFSYDGCAVSLTASDMARALWGSQYLRRILEDIEAVGEREREREREREPWPELTAKAA